MSGAQSGTYEFEVDFRQPSGESSKQLDIEVGIQGTGQGEDLNQYVDSI